MSRVSVITGASSGIDKGGRSRAGADGDRVLVRRADRIPGAR
jgi:NAD(P)-dependent dehydrogenase (short-subunit alcohol dehydrogenase family)